MKEIRFNANKINSARLRKIQREYKQKFAPSRISLEALANLALEYGTNYARTKLNIGD